MIPYWGQPTPSAATSSMEDKSVFLAPTTCPCGESAVAGQHWRTYWFDLLGIPREYISTSLCAAHLARPTLPAVTYDCARFGCSPEHCEYPSCLDQTGVA